jgi:hypothetical protein
LATLSGRDGVPVRDSSCCTLVKFFDKSFDFTFGAAAETRKKTRLAIRYRRSGEM